MATIQFSDPGSWVLSGMTLSGKTYWVYKLLCNKEVMFQNPPKKVMYCFSIWQPIFDKMRNELNVIFHEGVPSHAEILDFADDGNHTLICLDDLQHEIVNNITIEKLFTQICHHKRVSVIYIN